MSTPVDTVHDDDSQANAAGAALPVPPAAADDKRTRPNNVSHRAAKRNTDVQRYTVDLDREQRRALALYAADWEVDKSKIIRTLLFLLEADETLRERVRQELFAEEQ